MVTLIFEDGTDSYFARQQVLERLGQIDLPDGVTPNLGPLASPVGEILRYRLVNCAQTRAPECSGQDFDVPPRSLNDVKDLEEFVVERELLATPGVADDDGNRQAIPGARISSKLLRPHPDGRGNRAHQRHRQCRRRSDRLRARVSERERHWVASAGADRSGGHRGSMTVNAIRV